MKRPAVALLLIVTACASQDIIEAPRIKREMTMLEILRMKQPGQDKIVYEDKWFKYDLGLEYATKGRYDYSSALTSQCPVAGAIYTVIDKDTGDRVKDLKLNQTPCDPCHKR